MTDSRSHLVIAAALLVSACVSIPESPSAYHRVSVKMLHDHPEQWDGEKVEVDGIAVRQFEDYGLYQPLNDPCAGNPVGIFVDWDRGNWPKRMMRRGTFRGVFTLEVFKPHPAGEIVIDNAAPGPGPLTDVQLVKWNGPPMDRCP